MIRVELGEERDSRGRGHGVFEYSVSGHAVQRRSSEPLLDACRALKRMGEPTVSLVGLFRKGREKPDATCSVEWGATHTVREDERTGPVFVKYRPFATHTRYGST